MAQYLAVSAPWGKAVHIVSTCIRCATTTRGTYNSTKAGLPFPMCSSKLSGVSSSTFDANALPTESTVANSANENRMVVVVERGRWGAERGGLEPLSERV